jgi:lipopolysaccharide assembly protein A
VDDGRHRRGPAGRDLGVILQNGQRVRVRFLMADATLPLGVGLLFAALLGALLVLVAGAARVLQLRVVARRHRRADQPP